MQDDFGDTRARNRRDIDAVYCTPMFFDATPLKFDSDVSIYTKSYRKLTAGLSNVREAQIFAHMNSRFVDLDVDVVLRIAP